MDEQQLEELKAYLGAGFLVHFIENQIGRDKAGELTIEQLLQLMNDTIALVKAKMPVDRFKETWKLK